MGWEEVRRWEVIFGSLASVKECDVYQIRRIGRDGEGWEEEHGGLDQPSVRQFTKCIITCTTKANETLTTSF